MHATLTKEFNPECESNPKTANSIYPLHIYKYTLLLIIYIVCRVFKNTRKILQIL